MATKIFTAALFIIGEMFNSVEKIIVQLFHNEYAILICDTKNA